MTWSAAWRGIKVACLIIGTTIGAGYASGRELWEFFGSYGTGSQTAVLVAMALFTICCYVIMLISHQMQAVHYRPVLEEMMGPQLAKAYDVLIIFYLLSTTVVMFAGSGATLAYWQLSYWAGVALAGLAVLFVFLRETEGVMALNTILIPVLIACLLSACLFFLWPHLAQISFPTESRGESMAMGIAFAALNILPLVAVLSALGAQLNKGEILSASLLSGTTLALITLTYNQSLLFLSEEMTRYDVPLFAVMQSFSPRWTALVTLVLWLAIYTTAVSNIFGLVARFKERLHLPQWLLAGGIILMVIPLTSFGFTKLIQLLYPIYGLLNLFILAMILLYPIKKMLLHKGR